MFTQNLPADALPEHGALAYSRTVLSAFCGAKLRRYGTSRNRVWILRPKICCHLCFYWSRSSKTWKNHKSRNPLLKVKDDLADRYPDCFSVIGKFQSQHTITVISQSPQWSVKELPLLVQPCWTCLEEISAEDNPGRNFIKTSCQSPWYWEDQIEGTHPYSREISTRTLKNWPRHAKSVKNPNLGIRGNR